MKSEKELTALKEEVEILSRKLHELSDDELAQVTGGCGAGLDDIDRGLSVSEIIEKLLEARKKMKEQAKKQL